MYVVTSCWFSGFTSLPRTWFCTHLLRQTKLSTSRFEHVMLFTFILDLPCQLREKLARGWSDTLYICEGDTSYICEGIKICKFFSECRARAQERASAVVWVLSPAFGGLSLVLHEMPVANFYGRFLPLLWIMLVFKGPLLTLKGSLSCCLNFCNLFGMKRILTLLWPCSLLALECSLSLPPLPVAKLPSCIRFFLLSSTLRIAHLLVKAFCMLPKFPVPDCKF